MNDSIRRDYILNNLQLANEYQSWRNLHNRGGLRVYIRENRLIIDDIIESVRVSKRDESPAYYMMGRGGTGPAGGAGGPYG